MVDSVHISEGSRARATAAGLGRRGSLSPRAPPCPSCRRSRLSPALVVWAHFDGGYFGRVWYPSAIGAVLLLAGIAFGTGRLLPRSRPARIALLALVGTARLGLSLHGLGGLSRERTRGREQVPPGRGARVGAVPASVDTQGGTRAPGGVVPRSGCGLRDQPAWEPSTPRSWAISSSRLATWIRSATRMPPRPFPTMAFLPALLLACRKSTPAVLRVLLLAVAAFLLQFALLPQSRGGLIALAGVALLLLAVAPDRLRLVVGMGVLAGVSAISVGPIYHVYDVGIELSNAGLAPSEKVVGTALDDAARAIAVGTGIAAVVGALLVVIDGRLRPSTRTARTARARRRRRAGRRRRGGRSHRPDQRREHLRLGQRSLGDVQVGRGDAEHLRPAFLGELLRTALRLLASGRGVLPRPARAGVGRRQLRASLRRGAALLQGVALHARHLAAHPFRGRLGRDSPAAGLSRGRARRAVVGAPPRQGGRGRSGGRRRRGERLLLHPCLVRLAGGVPGACRAGLRLPARRAGGRRHALDPSRREARGAAGAPVSSSRPLLRQSRSPLWRSSTWRCATSSAPDAWEPRIRPLLSQTSTERRISTRSGSSRISGPAPLRSGSATRRGLGRPSARRSTSRRSWYAHLELALLDSQVGRFRSADRQLELATRLNASDEFLAEARRRIRRRERIDPAAFNDAIQKRLSDLLGSPRSGAGAADDR